VVIGGELAGGGQLSGQQPAGQRDAGQNPYLPGLCLGKEQFGRPVTEHIENNLNRLHAGIFQRLEAFFDLLHAYSVMAQLARSHQVVQHTKTSGS
jgi:hypothetical protein